MATSDTQIANWALKKLGAGRIESLTQDHPNARSINAVYSPVRDAELRRYDWNFAIRRDSIAEDSADALWGGWNRYTLPNDYVRLLRDDESGASVDWKIESDTTGRYILTTTASPLKIRYVAAVTDPNQFDALFAEALAAKLALECCEEITQSSSKKDRAQYDYDQAIAEAKRVGAIEKQAQEAPEDPWLQARR